MLAQQAMMLSMKKHILGLIRLHLAYQVYGQMKTEVCGELQKTQMEREAALVIIMIITQHIQYQEYTISLIVYLIQ